MPASMASTWRPAIPVRQGRGSDPADRRRDRLRRRAESRFLRPSRTTYSALAEACRKAGALLIVAVSELVSLGLVESPGAMGADIVTGEGQSIGNSLGFGGPYVGLFASREKYVRQMPGRLVRRDRRCRRQARLGADALDPRAAYPAREGDEQHLHQFRPLRAGLHDPSDPAGRGGLHPAGGAQPCRRRWSWPNGWGESPAAR